MENLTSRLEEIYGRKRWVLANQVAAATVNLVETLNKWGSETLVVASNPGTGDMRRHPEMGSRSARTGRGSGRGR